MTSELKSLLEREFSDPQKCYGHCDQPATVRFLEESDDAITVAYACHAGYLSRIVIYGRSVDQDEARTRISGLLGSGQAVTADDIRVATRRSRDLGVGPEDFVVRAVFWTQNYRRTKNDDPNRRATFLCYGCNGLFSKPVAERNVICPDCLRAR